MKICFDDIKLMIMMSRGTGLVLMIPMIILMDIDNNDSVRGGLIALGF